VCGRRQVLGRCAASTTLSEYETMLRKFAVGEAVGIADMPAVFASDGHADVCVCEGSGADSCTMAAAMERPAEEATVVLPLSCSFHRLVVHTLCRVYGMESESATSESGHRIVLVKRTPLSLRLGSQPGRVIRGACY
jgi:hypothetical protein